MAKYDEQLERMNYLMEFKTPSKKAISNIEYHANGADGKVYGILKEGTKYYIKTTEPGKENLSESYEYIGGYDYRRDNEFKDYNKATKHLELKLAALNEQYGKKGNVSTVDLKRSEKVLINLTEDARKELNRMHQILENSCKIGKDCVCDPESNGKSTGDNTKKNNAPFEEKAEAKLDKDIKETGTVKGATPDNKTLSDKEVENDLTSIKNKTKNSGSEKDYKKVNESIDGLDDELDEPLLGGEDTVDDGEDVLGGEETPELGAPVEEPEADTEDVVDDIDAASFEGDGEEAVEDETPVDDSLAGFEGSENPEDLEFESLLEDFKNCITGPDEVLDGPHGTDGKDAEWIRVGEGGKQVNEEEGNVNAPAEQGDEETLKNYKFGFNGEKKLDAQSWDKLNESISRIAEDVFKKLTTPKKETLQEAIDRIVKEEVTRLNAWGKHPRFRKQPMTLPQNKEVLAGTADRDWNDDSAKGEKPYGEKIGDGKPFDEVVTNLTDKVMAQLKESLKK
jgi:hypothetical protein